MWMPVWSGPVLSLRHSSLGQGAFVKDILTMPWWVPCLPHPHAFQNREAWFGFVCVKWESDPLVIAEGFSLALWWHDLTVEDDCQQSPLSTVSVPHALLSKWFHFPSWLLSLSNYRLLISYSPASGVSSPVCLMHTRTHTYIQNEFISQHIAAIICHFYRWP